LHGSVDNKKSDVAKAMIALSAKVMFPKF